MEDGDQVHVHAPVIGGGDHLDVEAVFGNEASNEGHIASEPEPAPGHQPDQGQAADGEVPAEDPARAANKITVIVKDQQYNEISFRIKPTMNLKKTHVGVCRKSGYQFGRHSLLLRR